MLVASVGGCQADEIDPREFSLDLCTADGLAVLGQTEPAEPVDGVELRDVSRIWDPELMEEGWGVPQIVDAFGEPCGGATDRATCEEAYAMLPYDSEFYSGGFGEDVYRSVAYGRGDEVGAVGTDEGLLEFLGTIDAPGDAALLAILRNHTLVCGAGNDVGERPDGTFTLHTISGGCNVDTEEHMLIVHPDGTIETAVSELIEKGDPGCAIGRLPGGHCRPVRRRASASAVGAFLAQVAELEASAVTAFRQLAVELRLHRAPSPMLRTALRSASDEVRHARSMGAHAGRYGGRPVRPRTRGWAPRPLVEVAMDNAAEGCVRETFGALVAHVQARRAADPMLRRALSRIRRR